MVVHDGLSCFMVVHASSCHGLVMLHGGSCQASWCFMSIHNGSWWFMIHVKPVFFGSCMVVHNFFEFMVVHGGSCHVHGG